MFAPTICQANMTGANLHIDVNRMDNSWHRFRFPLQTCTSCLTALGSVHVPLAACRYHRLCSLFVASDSRGPCRRLCSLFVASDSRGPCRRLCSLFVASDSRGPCRRLCSLFVASDSRGPCRRLCSLFVASDSRGPCDTQQSQPDVSA